MSNSLGYKNEYQHSSSSSSKSLPMSTQPQGQSVRVMSRNSAERSSQDSLQGLANSSNMFAAGIGEALQAFIATAHTPNTKPIMVEFGNRVMAVGRQRMLSMNGRNALLYMKSKFGLLNSTTALYIQATFEGDEERFVEVDLDSWEEARAVGRNKETSAYRSFRPFSLSFSMTLTIENEVSPLAQVHRAYQRLTHSELVLFLKVRNLPTTGTDAELASRLSNHDIHTYHFRSIILDRVSTSSPTLTTKRQSMTRDLPVEILADIMDHFGDWELAKAVGVPTSITQPSDWTRATRTDWAVITGQLSIIRSAKPSAENPLTKVGATLIIRFGYVNVLEYFLSQHHKMFLDVFEDDLIPIKASRHGRLNILSWWKHAFEQHPDLVPPPKRSSIAEAVDRASRNGHIDSLDWWLNWGYPIEYTEAALEYASSKNQIAVLDWWKRQHKELGLPLKIGRAMDMASTAGHVEVLEWWAGSQLDPKYDRYALQHASCHGKIEVLQWWLGSGLPLIFDQEALTGATRYNRPEVLDWWDKSGLPINYRMCDIEEALEESIIPGDDAREWWREKGVDFNANDKEWMKLQGLN